MGKFGWSYPPGVTGNEPELTGDCGPCDCCGHAAEDCICPACTVCGEHGNSLCYIAIGETPMGRHPSRAHGMVYNMQQQIGQATLRVMACKDALADAESTLEYLKEAEANK
jgi:hypothetical protein